MRKTKQENINKLKAFINDSNRNINRVSLIVHDTSGKANNQKS